jgi:hypothetical protein
MSILTLKARPIIAFDENNLEHRRYFSDFIKRKTWGYCPVRFMADDVNNDLVSHINRKMLDYYITKEFNCENTLKAKTKPKPKSTPGAVRGRKPVQTKSRATKKQISTSPKA